MAGGLVNFNLFYSAEALLASASPTGNVVTRSIYRFRGSSIGASSSATGPNIPIHVRTGQRSFGNPTERNRFTQIEFHGRGTIYCRVYVDGRYICQGTATMTETPDKERRIGIPTGTRGYTMDLEFCGDADIRAVEFEFKPLRGTS